MRGDGVVGAEGFRRPRGLFLPCCLDAGWLRGGLEGGLEGGFGFEDEGYGFFGGLADGAEVAHFAALCGALVFRRGGV